jgi:hypothetical protein
VAAASAIATDWIQLALVADAAIASLSELKMPPIGSFKAAATLEWDFGLSIEQYKLAFQMWKVIGEAGGASGSTVLEVADQFTKTDKSYKSSVLADYAKLSASTGFTCPNPPSTVSGG